VKAERKKQKRGKRYQKEMMREKGPKQQFEQAPDASKE
jgi:hypothetical protein